MNEFRPISLCNVSYKIISNVLANRLKPILSTIILENQSAFVLGCLITDNVLVAFQIMHYLKKKKGKESYMAVELNISKAYDRVEWCFLKKVMERMGFNDKWISLIMNCITTLTYFVLINGVAQGCITPTRGLRQGDPISLYLFLLCLEGFIGLILEATRNNRLSRISIYRNCPTVSHLFFADDSILYYKASEQESRELQRILHKYEEATGQKINTIKSSVFFSRNTKEEKREEVKDILGSMQDTQPKKYLGLPSMIGKSKKQVFNEIKERVGKKLMGLKEKLLSIGGREILIKAVA